MVSDRLHIADQIIAVIGGGRSPHRPGPRARRRSGDLGDLRGLLAELSRDRARQGFTSTETAIVVFGLKEAIYETVEEDGSPEAVRGFIWFSRVIDDLGLFTVESHAAAGEQIIIDQAEQLLELSTPVVKLWDGIVAVPLVGMRPAVAITLVEQGTLITVTRWAR